MTAEQKVHPLVHLFTWKPFLGGNLVFAPLVNSMVFVIPGQAPGGEIVLCVKSF